MSRCTALLSCPICTAPLAPDGTAVRCPARHTFNRARAGYIDLLPPGHGRSGIRGDVSDMVEARRRVLERGHYRFISDAVNERALAALPPQPVVLDAGCGEGWYLRRLAAAHAADGYFAAGAAEGTGQNAEPRANTGAVEPCFIGADISRDALRAAARAQREALFIINDTARRLTLADGSVDVVLDIFAPRNAAEFARVLRPGGTLIVVVPADDHLRELRAHVPLLEIAADKLDRTAAALSGMFTLRSAQELRTVASFSAQDVRDAVLMGPSYWHADRDAVAAVGPLRVGLAVHILVLQRYG